MSVLSHLTRDMSEIWCGCMPHIYGTSQLDHKSQHTNALSRKKVMCSLLEQEYRGSASSLGREFNSKKRKKQEMKIKRNSHPLSHTHTHTHTNCAVVNSFSWHAMPSTLSAFWSEFKRCLVRDWPPAPLFDSSNASGVKLRTLHFDKINGNSWIWKRYESLLEIRMRSKRSKYQ